MTLVRPLAPVLSLDDRYESTDGVVYLSGIHALVRMLFERSRHDRGAGLDIATFVSGYEGSPLAGYDLELSRRSGLLAEHGIVHRPALNEELAATAVAGTQLAGEVADLKHDGVTGFWYGKAPGLDRATDALRHANLVGTSGRGGAVALVGDDPSAKSSSVPCSSEFALADLIMPTLYPADPAEVLVHGLHAVELSRASGLWSAIKVTTNVADGSGTAALKPIWTPPDLSDLPSGLRPYSHRPSSRMLGAELAALEHSQHELRLPIALEYIRRSGLNRVLGNGPARVGIVAAGKTYLDLRQALAMMGLTGHDLERSGIRLLKLGVIYPVEPSVVVSFADGLDQIIVVEDKRAFIEDSIRSILYGRPDAPRIAGKRDLNGRMLFAATGELDPKAVAAGLARALAWLKLDSVQSWRPPTPPARSVLTMAARTPYFCSGCPHNSSTKVAPGTLVGGGIGCHSMVLFMPERQVGAVTGLTQMGGEGGHWIGMSPFVEQRHFVQNLGDGTFAHSGSLAIRAAVAAGVNVTFKILRNSAVAMTGGQQAVGELPLPRLISLLEAEGVAKVVVTSDDPAAVRSVIGRRTDVRDRDDLVLVQQELAELTGVTVLIHEQECAAELRRKRRRGKRVEPA
ncbi:MAG: Indolepyruvate ferredoxin oxidoreductase, partial [Pseudonocardiales bacterium]|nr:Indolepyruvate ferredoxin oxidoreductase [Pseudonocardiales bacterium]